MAHRRTHLAGSLLLVCLVAHSMSMPMHPDLLSFAKLPTAGGSLEEELEQSAARTLQQADPFPDPGGAISLRSDKYEVYKSLLRRWRQCMVVDYV